MNIDKNNIIIPDEKKLDTLKENIRLDGLDKLQVVSDFDKTLTSCFVDGKKIVSLISILRDENYLTPDYSEKAQALYDKFHPIELDQILSLSEKKTRMHEWWSLHYELLVKSGLSRKDLSDLVKSKKISLRSGALDFFDFLHLHDIPLVIFSAAGVGTETIALYLERFEKKFENVYIVSNEFIWDDDGAVSGVKEPIIHTFNKEYGTIVNSPFYKQIKSRRNVILLGDSLGDASMVNGFEYDNLIKIGFLNENEKGELADFKNIYDIVILNDGPMNYILESFKKTFDTVILNDGPMDYVNILLRELAIKK